jgi:hypothetical protein
MGFKKYFVIGMLAILLLSAGIMVFAKLGEEKPLVNNTVIVTNNTNVVNTSANKSADDIAGFETFDDPKIVNADIFFKINAEGSDNISFKVSSFAVHNGFYDKWYIVNTKATGIGELFTNVSADAGVFYNKVYIYVPEITVNVNGSEKTVSMPSNKIYFEGDFVKIHQNQSAYFELTFLKDNSLFENSDGTFVFAPQIKVSVYANATENNLTGGGLWTGLIVGMDNNGKVQAGLKYTPE